jgi:hypothetical protein
MIVKGRRKIYAIEKLRGELTFWSRYPGVQIFKNYDADKYDDAQY